MTQKSILIGLLIIVNANTVALAQRDAVRKESDSIVKQSYSNHLDKGTATYQETHNTGTLSDFPRLHPMIVHFPIVFLLFAFLVQLGSLFFLKKELSWAALCLVTGGFIGAYLAANVFHGGDPNLKLLDSISRSNFEEHKLYALYTVWISGIAVLLKIFSQFIFKKHIIVEILVTVLLLGSAYTITITGDMGARLVHIDAIGVKGNKIPEHDDD